MYLALDEGDCGMPAIALWTDRVWTGIVCAGFVGGLATALLGSGVDVFVFLFVVIVAGLHPRVGVPTSVLAMAMVSMTGFLVLGILDGQLATTVVGEEVVAVGGIAVSPLPALHYDLFGMWLAAVPIVVVGAPLGTVFVHMLGESRLIFFVAGMAALEVISTAIFLEPLRTDPTLLITALVALGGALAGVRILHGRRSHILGDAAPAAQLPAPEMSRAG